MITALIVCLLFISFIFIECSHNGIAGAYGNKLSMPYCSRSCVCDPDIRFTPVCPNKSTQTYFSPCHAGCMYEIQTNGERTFGACTCGVDPDMMMINKGVSTVTEGACGYENCQKMWIIFQILLAFGMVCIGSRLVGKMLITVRSVLQQDTAIALALELSLGGLIAYVPGFFAYKYIAGESQMNKKIGILLIKKTVHFQIQHANIGHQIIRYVIFIIRKISETTSIF